MVIKNSPEEYARFGVQNVPKEFLTRLSQQKRPSKATNAFANVDENDLLEFNSAYDNSINRISSYIAEIDSYSVSDKQTLESYYLPQEKNEKSIVKFKKESNRASPLQFFNVDTYPNKEINVSEKPVNI